MKKILMLCPNNQLGSPANERFLSYVDFFKNQDYELVILDFPKNIFYEFFLLLKIIYQRADYLFISQPPFRFWMVFFVPFIKIILDIRDGWSISIKSGYGGTVKPNKLKYNIVSFVERIIVHKAFLVITCTTGLRDYLSVKYNKKILLISNGISRDSFELINREAVIGTGHEVLDNKNDKIVFTCAGQFSEYGEDKVKLILETINHRYGLHHCIIQVVGANKNKNLWLCEYLKKYNNMSYVYVDRVSKEKLYSILKSSDYALTIIRDPLYEYGTKIFEYLACNLKVVNYFDERNNFTDYFDGAFDVNFKKNNFENLIVREDIFDINQQEIIGKLE